MHHHLRSFKTWLFAAALAWLACTASWAHAATITVRDLVGRNVTVPHNPQRIVGIGAGTLRLLVYMQAADRVVGVEDVERNYLKGKPSKPYMTANPQLMQLPRVGPGGSNMTNKKPDYEDVLKAKPDVVFMTQMDPALADEVQKTLGIPVVILSYGKTAGSFDEEIYSSLTLVGKILKREKRAQDLIAFIQNTQADLRRRVAGQKPASAYVGAVSYNGAHGINGSAKSYIPFEWLGVHNLAKTAPGGKGSHVKLDKEALLALNPEPIFMDAAGEHLVRQDLQANPHFYGALRAFANRRVYRVYPYVWYITNIDVALLDAYAVGKVLYPKQFADVDLAQKADAIFTFMVGKPVYQEMRQGFGALAEPVVF